MKVQGQGKFKANGNISKNECFLEANTYMLYAYVRLVDLMSVGV